MIGQGRKARFYSRLDDGRLLCELCPRACKLRDGQRAFCFVRQNVGATSTIVGMLCESLGRRSDYPDSAISTVSFARE